MTAWKVGLVGILAWMLVCASDPENAIAQKPDSADQADPAKEPVAPPQLQQAYGLCKAAKTIEDYTMIIDLCREGLAAEPEGSFVGYGKRLGAWAYNRRGELYAKAKEPNDEAALADFEAAVAGDPKKWRHLHNRSVSYAMAGESERALADVNRLIEMRPDFAKAHYNRGELRFQLGKLDEAIRDYTQAIRLAPRDAAAFSSRGFAYHQQQNWRAALSDYNRAIALDRNNAEAHVNRGNWNIDRSRLTEGIRDFEQAIRIDPEYGPAYVSAAWFRATCPQPRYRDAASALRSANKAIALDGEGPRYLDALAAAYAAGGDFEKAVATQKKTIEADPENREYAGRLKLYEGGKAYIDSINGNRDE